MQKSHQNGEPQRYSGGTQNEEKFPLLTQRQGREGGGWGEGRRERGRERLFVGCLTCQQHISVSQGRICSDNLTCCHTEIEVADETFHLTQSQYTDTGPTSPDPILSGT